LLTDLLYVLAANMSENWDEEGDVAVDAGAAAASAAAVVAELPEIKLFGKWSCEEVNISDMSLQVRALDAATMTPDVQPL